MKTIIVICILLAATIATASAAKCNQHGAVVTLKNGTVLYLGKNCDATLKDGGTGKWWNAASFLGVKIDGKAYMVKEEIDCLPFCST